MVVAVIPVRSVKATLDQIVNVIVVRHGLVTAAIAMGVCCVARSQCAVAAWMGLINRDHVFVDVILVRMM